MNKKIQIKSSKLVYQDLKTSVRDRDK